METVGTRVKSLRKSKSLTQKQLADKCGISQPSLAKIELNGTESPKGYVLDALARELRTTTGFILYGDIPEAKSSEKELIDLCKQMDVKDLEFLLKIARSLAIYDLAKSFNRR